MTIRLSSSLNVSAQTAFEQVKRPALLQYVAHPLIRFVPSQPFPVVWQTGEYKTTVLLFGRMPVGQQTIGIEYPGPTAGGVLRLRDRGRGHLAQTWDHWIFIEPTNENQCRYTDRVTIRAGLLTVFVGLFALGFYAWRQYRWKRLTRLHFGPIDFLQQ